MSATHSWSGALAVKLRSTRSGAGRTASARTVVGARLRRLTPCKPATRISLATRLRPTDTPFASSSVWILAHLYSDPMV